MQDINLIELARQAALRLLILAVLLLVALLVLYVGVQMTRFAQRAAGRMVDRRSPGNVQLKLALTRMVGIAGVGAAIAVALAALGVDVGAVIAGLGLTSIAIGFALKETIEQAIAGLYLLVQQPFRVGDVIELDNVEGVVQDVAIRTTNLRTFDGVHVLVPNNRVFHAIIRNKSHYPTRRFQVMAHLAVGTNLATAHALMHEAVMRVPGVMADPAPQVTFEVVDPAVVRTLVRYWIEPGQPGSDPIHIQNAVLETVLTTCRANGIELAAPVAPMRAAA